MTMETPQTIAAKEVERCSKVGMQRLQEGFPDKALTAFRSAYMNAQSLSQHGYMVRACAFNLGAMLISTNSFVEGIAYLNKAIPPDGKRDGRSNGDLYYNYGLAYEGLKNVSKAKQSFEFALKDYRTEGHNVKMEADTISHLSRLCLENNLLSEADNWMKQLPLLYSNLGESQKELQSKVDRSNLLLKMDQAQEAQAVADECFQNLESTPPDMSDAKMYSDLCVAYTQIMLYDKAIQCSEKALPLVEEPNGDPRLAAVLYQNLGAIYNYMSQFDNALKYHQKACNTYAKLQMRTNQGHCFTNMGYAYSQLKEMDKAGECFLHGLQAARDCGDLRTEWQNLEALASVAYHKRSLRKAEQYYQQAVSVLARTPEGGDPVVHKRLITKLKHVIQSQVSRPPSTPAKETMTNSMVHRASLHRDSVNYKDLESLATEMESGNIKVIRKGSQVRYLKVRRSGTLRQFKKIALGLEMKDGEGDIEEKKEERDGTDSSEESSKSSSEESEDESGKEKDRVDSYHEEDRKKAPVTRPPDSYLNRGSNHSALFDKTEMDDEGSVEQLSAGENSDDSDDEVQMKRLMQQQLAKDNEKQQDISNTQMVTADVHENLSSDADTSESSESEQEVNQRLKPPVPEQSPEPTGEKSLRTYEKPVKNPDGTYESIHSKPSTSKMADTDDSHGVNYFHEDDRQNSKTEETDEKIYESLRPQLSKSLSKKEIEVVSDANETSEDDYEKYSRGEKESILYKQHVYEKNKRQGAAEDDKQPEEMGDQKSSTHCIVM